MKNQSVIQFGFWTKTVVLAFIGLLLVFSPDWGHELRAQSLSPASYSFGTVITGNSKTAAFTVQNTLSNPINLSGIQAGAAPFAAASSCPGTLAIGASCSIQVSFVPTSAGNYTGTLSVTWVSKVPPPPPGEVPPSGTLTASLSGVGVSVIAPLTAVNDSATTPQDTAVTIAVLGNDTGGVKPLSVSAVGSPSHGIVTNNGGSVTYIPTTGYSGTDSFSYTAQDSGNPRQTSSATVTVTVTPLKLTAVNDSATTRQDQAVTIAVLTNDTGGVKPLSVSAVGSPSHGTVTNNGGSVTYTPTTGYSGTDSFSYTAEDAGDPRQTSSATVTVTVTPLKLTAVNDSATTAQNTAVTIAVLGNDTGGVKPLSVSAVGSPSHGTVTNNGGSVTYTPTTGYSGTDSFSYTAEDAGDPRQTSSATVTVTVTPLKLTAVNDSATTRQDQAVTIAVLANDTGGVKPLSVSAVGSPSHGTVTNNGGSVTYTPTTGYSGTDSFSYTAADASSPAQTSSATVTVTITPIKLTAVNDSATTAQNTAVTIAVLGNDTGGVKPLSVSAVGSPSHGTVTNNGGSVTYTPTTGYSGTDSFSYTAADASSPAQTSSATVTVTVTPIAPPKLVAVNDSATTTQDQAVTIAVLVNDTGGVKPLSVSAVSSPSHGTIVDNGGSVTYTPDPGYSGTDSFSYTAKDDIGQTSSATVTVTVTPLKLTAVNDSATTRQDQAVTIAVLANDTGGVKPLSVSAVGSPSHGTVVDNGGSVTYTPTTGYSGTDSFSYTAADASSPAQTSSATVTVTITPVAPGKLVAVPDSATTRQDQAVTIAVLANDTGGAPPLKVNAISDPSHGTVVNNGGSVTYTPTTGYSGTDSFSYTAVDKDGQISNSATVTVTITPVAPGKLVAVPDSATTSAGKEVSISVLANDTGGVKPLSISAVGSPQHGAAAINGDAIQYTPTAGYSGTDSFSYTAQDKVGQIASATVTVTVTPGEKTPEEALEDAATSPNAEVVGSAIASSCTRQNASAAFLRDCTALIGAAKNNDPATGGALNQITPDTVNNAPTATAVNAKTQMVNIQSRLSSLRTGIMGIDIERLDIKRGGWTLSGRDLSYLLASVDGGGTPSAEVTPKSEFGPLGIFASGSLNFGNMDTTENQTGFDFKALVMAVGMDYRFTDRLVLGTAFSYVDNENKDAANSGSLDTRGYSLALYGTYYQSDNFYIDGIIDYGWNNYDQQRNVNYQLQDAQVNQTFSSQYNGKQLFVDIGAGYNFSYGNLTIGPRVRLSYLDMQVDPFQEQVNNNDPGSGWAVAIEEQSLQSLVSKVGGRASYLIDQPWGVLQPQFELSWLHEFEDNNRQVQGWFVQGATVPDNQFYLLVDPIDPNYFELGLGVTARFNSGPIFQLQYRTLFGYENLNLNSITAQFRWEF